MKRLLAGISFGLMFCTFALVPIQAQVAKKVIVEHFTNTRCSICASRNPGFFQNLDAFPEVIHLQIHPSSPYSSCLLSMHNRLENDARTDYYSIYGATPRIVIQGQTVSPSTNYGDPGLLTQQLNQTTPFSLLVKEIRRGLDSVQIIVTIKALSAHSEISGSLYVAYAESPVNYAAPNGESVHRNVFRKAFSPSEGANVQLPASGDSLIWTSTIATDPVWDLEKMHAVAILQTEFKLVLQAEMTTEIEEAPATSLDRSFTPTFTLFPNPASDHLRVEGLTGDWKIIGIDGKEWINRREEPGQADFQIDLSTLPAGTYLLQHLDQGRTAGKIFVKR